MIKKLLLTLLCFSCSPVPPVPTESKPVQLSEVTIEGTVPKPQPKRFIIKATVKYSDENAKHNAEFAASRVNNTELEPGEIFSFNNTVGERTEAAGFKAGTILFAGVEKPGVGGGVCQVSTVLYIAAMKAGLEVVERHPHSRARDYAGPGKDAAVNWPNLDFKIRNNTAKTIKIESGIDKENVYATLVFKHKPETKLIDTIWIPSNPVPFEINKIKSKFIKKELVSNSGQLGYPGHMIWDYGDRKVKVYSDYKPISKLVVAPSYED